MSHKKSRKSPVKDSNILDPTPSVTAPQPPSSKEDLNELDYKQIKDSFINKFTGFVDTDEYKAYKFIQDRWDKEDQLLNSRTGFFLTINAILFAAIRLD